MKGNPVRNPAVFVAIAWPLLMLSLSLLLPGTGQPPVPKANQVAADFVMPPLPDPGTQMYFSTDDTEVRIRKFWKDVHITVEIEGQPDADTTPEAE